MLITRVLAAAVFTPAILAAIWVGGSLLAATCAALGLVMLWEYLNLTLGPGQGSLKGLAYALGCSLLGTTLGLLPAWVATLQLPIATLAVFVAVLFRPQPIDGSVHRAATTLLGVAYCGGLIAYLFRLRQMPEVGLCLSGMALLCTWGSDTGAYFAGRAAGRHKLYPAISPAKTVEGALGGILVAIAVALAMRQVFSLAMPAGHVMGIGCVAAVFGMLGDLCESMLKRSVGAKDSSRLIPGHGGVLDRFDGVLFAVPAVFVYVAMLPSATAIP